MQQFSCMTQIISGPGSIRALEMRQIRRLFLVTDPYFTKNDTAERVVQASGAEQWELFDEVCPDPSLELAARGTARLRSFRPDWVAALGGGSALDTAKAMVYFSGLPVRLAAIPTTSGSGSEVSSFAVLTHGNAKHPLVDPKLQPELAILDSDFLQQLPPGLIADTGFDVLTHAAEAMASKDSGIFVKTLAKEAFSLCYQNLYASFCGDQTVRLPVHLASCMAGLAFSQGGLGLCHALSHSLGGQFHVPHGRLNAVLLPAVIGANARAAEQAYRDLARSAGLGAGAGVVALRNLRGGLIRLRGQLHLPDTLAGAGISPAALAEKAETITAAALEDPCCGSNPRPVDASLVHQILREVAGRG